MSWLKKAGLIALKVIGIASGALPLLSGVLPKSADGAATKVVSELEAIGNVVTTVEQVVVAVTGPDAKNGAQKLAAATPYVATLIQESELMVGKKVKDEAAFTAACTKITSGFADLLNAVE